MNSSVLSLVLVAAAIYATWNAMLKIGADRLWWMTMLCLASGILAALVIPFVPVPAPASWPYIASSAALHVAYQFLLVHTYSRGEFSQTYPIARGSAPMMVTVGGFLLAGEALTGLEILGVATVSGGFDTHSSQSWAHWDLLRQLGNAMQAFYDATAEMGVADKVTTFTESDFGRTLQPSGSGSDHGWGSHHLVMGGAVKGGDIYGTFPTLALGNPDDANLRGVLISTTSIDQYGATMAKWFGVNAAAMPQVFPNLGNFATSDLGFLA